MKVRSTHQAGLDITEYRRAEAKRLGCSFYDIVGMSYIFEHKLDTFDGRQLNSTPENLPSYRKYLGI